MIDRIVRRGISCLLLLICLPVWAANLADIQVSNGSRQARIVFSFTGNPDYAFSQNDKKSVTLDIQQQGIIQGLPLQFSGNNLVQRIRAGQPAGAESLRLIVDLTRSGKTRVIKQQSGTGYTVAFIINADAPVPSSPPTVITPPVSPSVAPLRSRSSPSTPAVNPFHSPTVRNNSRIDGVPPPLHQTKKRQLSGTVIVAIDAGHGGQDPGAIGPNGIKEKNVTIAIAQKLSALLNNDSMFKGVLTREGDYFISVLGRSDVARKQNANLLVSIHADSAPNRGAHGASVWVLSNRRANSELAGWLEQHEKQSELLGGAGDVLSNSQADRYLSQAVLDLQFGHSQHVGYDVAEKILSQLQRVSKLHKRRPEHASLGVLRSPDIPSVLVETGFISNNGEERLLASEAYQQQIAQAIYEGLRNYFLSYPLQSAPGAALNRMATGG